MALPVWIAYVGGVVAIFATAGWAFLVSLRRYTWAKVVWGINAVACILALFSAYLNAMDMAAVLLCATVLTMMIMVIGAVKQSKEVVKSGFGWFVPLAAFFVIRSFLYDPYRIPSASMLPGLVIGDFILIERFAYSLTLPLLDATFFHIDEPSRGDIVVFLPPKKSAPYIKRVVGLPGDRISYRGQLLTINGAIVERRLVSPPDSPILVEEEYLERSRHMVMHFASRRGLVGSWVVPEGHYFLLGDNRENSADSRVFGPVPLENIRGRASFRWMHFTKESGLSFERAGPLH